MSDRTEFMKFLALFTQLEGHNETLSNPQSTQEEKKKAEYWIGEIEKELALLDKDKL
jgi:hypothetical protein